MKKKSKQTAVIMSAAMFFGVLANPASSTQAAKKTMLKSKSMTLNVNQSRSVILKNKVAGATYTFKSKNSKIAVVTKKGKVTGKKQGTTTITVNQKKNKRLKLVGKVKVKVRKAENQAKVSPDVTTSPIPAVSSTAAPTVAATGAPVGTNTPDATKAPERTHITGDKELKELLHNIFKANQPEAIFKNHTSVSYSYRYADGTYRNHYSTGESDYYDENGYAEYRTNDRIFYYMYMDGIGKENPDLSYMVDVSKNYSPIWDWYAKDNEKEFYDEEYDKITDCYIEDGRVYVFICLDEETSEYFVKEIFGREYTGQKVLCKIVADAKTYELYWDGEYIEGDEDIKNAVYYELRYDEPEPKQSCYMRAFFKRPAEKYMTVTYVGIHSDGTKVTKSVKVPANSEVKPWAPDIPDFKIYNDEECTIPQTEHWDRNSDIILYIASEKHS